MVEARLDPDAGARLIAAGEAAVNAEEQRAAAESAAEDHVSAETRMAVARQRNRERPARRADALVAVVENADGEPLSIGRRTRAVLAPMRRALHARDRGCRFPGCIATRRLEAHHVHHWAAGGETATSNLAELCSITRGTDMG